MQVAGQKFSNHSVATKLLALTGFLVPQTVVTMIRAIVYLRLYQESRVRMATSALREILATPKVIAFPAMR